MTTITTLATIPAILALVTLAKDLGLPAKAAPLVATVLGATLSLTDTLLAGYEVYGALTSGLLLGLAAAGLYDTAKLIRPNTGTSVSEEAQE